MWYSSAGSLIRRRAPRLDLPKHCQLPRQSLMACAATRAALSLLGAAIVVSAGADAPETLLPEFDLRSAPACYSLLSSAGPIGCRTPVPAGVTAPIALVDSQSDLDALLEQEPISSMQQAKMTAVLLPQPLLTRGNLLALQRSGRCAGVLLAESPTPPPQGFSPADIMPYCRCGSAPPCAGAAWNPHGQNLTEVNLDFPMVLLTATQAATVRRRVQRASPDPASFPHYMVHMNYYMDAFEGYALRPGDVGAGAGHSWWETQAAATCCAHCQPTCGTHCCAPGFECLAPLPHSEPTSVSCLERGTCLPIGGFSVWSLNKAAMLDTPSSPTTPGQRGRVVMVTANLDSSALFHDLAVGFAAEASALVALIAAADALRAFRANMASHHGAAVLFAALQAENWDHMGARRLFDDMEHFRCRKRRALADALARDVCEDPPLLAPEIEHVNASMVDFVLHVDQLMPPTDGASLFLHTGCSPTPHTEAMASLLLGQPSAMPASAAPAGPKPQPPDATRRQPPAAHAGVLGLVGASPGLPLPPSSFLPSLFPPRTSGDPPTQGVRAGTAPDGASARDGDAAPKGMAVLAGYDSVFHTSVYHSRFDTRRAGDEGGEEPDLERLCAAASRLGMMVYSLATGLRSPAIRADCELVRRLVGRLSVVDAAPATPGAPLAAQAYASVYQPAWLRGPSKRERFVHEELAAANAVDTAACDCCVASLSCPSQKHTHCLRGKCVRSFTFLHDTYPLGVEFSAEKRGFVVSNESRFVQGAAEGGRKHEIWAESSWQANVGTVGFLRDDPRAEQAGMALGLCVSALSGVGAWALLRHYNRHYKQS